MVMKRIIPCLDVKDGRVVKGVSFEGLADCGDPVALASRYAEQGADELVFLDITAGVEGRGTAVSLAAQVARGLFIPFTLGGGLRTVADARSLLRAGCDKVAVNSAAVRRPELLSELADAFGRQAVVLAVDVRREGVGYRVVVDAGRTPTDWTLEAWLDEAQTRGAGEVLLTSMDEDGHNRGYDLTALARASARLRIPLVASGGFGGPAHARDAFAAGADAALLASSLHRGGWTVGDLKTDLARMGVEVRTC